MVVDKSSQRSYQLKFGNLLKNCILKISLKIIKKNKKNSTGGASSTALLDNNYNIK
jgi:hypothetical protein